MVSVWKVLSLRPKRLSGFYSNGRLVLDLECVLPLPRTNRSLPLQSPSLRPQKSDAASSGPKGPGEQRRSSKPGREERRTKARGPSRLRPPETAVMALRFGRQCVLRTNGKTDAAVLLRSCRFLTLHSTLAARALGAQSGLSPQASGASAPASRA